MKRLSLFALAAAGMLLGACTSGKDEVASEKLNQYDLIEGQSAWIAVGIALPGDPITRTNEDLNDGDEAEFTVHSAKLVLFKGSSEDNAKLVKDYDITPTSWTPQTWPNESGDNVPGGNTEGIEANKYGEITSTSSKVIQEIEAPSLGVDDNLYAYVIVNWKNNNTSLSFTKDTPFSTFKKAVLKAIGIADESKGYGVMGENGLVMTNVPIADSPGGDTPPIGAKITTLAKIDESAIYETKEAATAGTSMACIYVERAAVKVEVEYNVSQVALGNGTKVNCTINGWALGNVNSSATGYYNTRQFDEDWLPFNNTKAAADYLVYRMVGRTQFFTNTVTHTKAYRTYFGKDVNYSSNDPANKGLIGVELADADYTLGDKGVVYTYENTFDEDNQVYRNTTYVGFKVTLDLPTDENAYYTITGQPNTMLMESDLPGQLAKDVNAKTNIENAISAINTAINTDLNSNSSTLNAGKSGDDVLIKINYDIEPDITLNTTRENDGSVTYSYKLVLKNVKGITKGGTTADLSATDLTTLKAITAVKNQLDAIYEYNENNNDPKIYKFVGGVTYYAARIAHFGDNETPWSAPSEAYNDYDKVYPSNGKSLENTTATNYSTSRASAWLGRWGIVRNNWYKLSLDAITGLGTPVPLNYGGTGEGEPGDTPDDNPKPKYYIAAHVHILPWAVRNQSVNF